MDQLTDAILAASQAVERHALEHCCSHSCPGGEYVYGMVPDGWLARLAVLAKKSGYTMYRSDKPRLLNGDGCLGFTVSKPRNFAQALEMSTKGIEPYSIHFRPDSSEAEQFSVVAHEITHALLGHADTHRFDDYEHEIPARLASLAVCEKAGLQTGQQAICQMTRRMRDTGVRPDHQHAALHAARLIDEALGAELRVAA